MDEVDHWDVVDSWDWEARAGYYLGSSIDYLLRCGKCGKKAEKVQELKQAKYHIEKLIEVLQEPYCE
jgi:hypothetical protein